MRVDGVRRIPGLAAVAVIAAASVAPFLAGCGDGGIEEPSPVGSTGGTLTVRWTIEGSADPSRCEGLGATALELLVYDVDGTFEAARQPACRDLAVSLTIPEGAYDVNATLVGPASEAISLTVPVEHVEIARGGAREIAVDFPRRQEQP